MYNYCLFIQDSDVPALALAANTGLSEEDIKQCAIIYKKESVRPLSEYQKSINKTAQEICLQNPMYLRSRQKLLDAARSKVDQTYAFKKGKSRSKKYSTDSDQSASKRPRLSFDARADRMKALEEEVKNIKERISYKEKRREMAENIKNYKNCDDLTEEISSLSKQRRELESELVLLQKKDKRAKSYLLKKQWSFSQGSDDSFNKPRSLAKRKQKSKKSEKLQKYDESESMSSGNESNDTITVASSDDEESSSQVQEASF